ncbi:hypothetical protein VN97_g5090 [Penicillium thymicola]|uniref:Uncharacterized protein n=1 Tax=Penicillium thymicola TaxID=293382 RepID=A0AAI9X905_PENTH|nr:hypothetical protein VN97_g5090 [Penicillium thymicola]
MRTPGKGKFNQEDCLAIVVKPKPATVRLVDIVESGVSRGVFKVVITCLPSALKPKPAAVRLVGIELPKPVTIRLVVIEVDERDGGSNGWSRWRIEAVVTSLPIVLKLKPATVRLVVIEPADCPEAEARHGQTGWD